MDSQVSLLLTAGAARELKSRGGGDWAGANAAFWTRIKRLCVETWIPIGFPLDFHRISIPNFAKKQGLIQSRLPLGDHVPSRNRRDSDAFAQTANSKDCELEWALSEGTWEFASFLGEQDSASASHATQKPSKTLGPSWLIYGMMLSGSKGWLSTGRAIDQPS